MSTPEIRRAIEKRLAAMPGVLPTAYQNAQFTPPAPVGNGKPPPYQRLFLLPAMTDNRTVDEKLRDETGFMQVSLVYPTGNGPGAAEAMAEKIREWFPAGLELIEGGEKVRVRGTPSISSPVVESNVFTLPVSIRYRSIQKD